MLTLFPCSVLRWAQMWLETKENNEQLREEVEVAKEELSNTKKKLEEALVVCVHRSLPFLSLYQQSFKPFNQVPCYSAALLSPRPVSFFIFQPHWIEQKKIVVWYFNHTESKNRRGKTVVWYFNRLPVQTTTIKDSSRESWRERRDRKGWRERSWRRSWKLWNLRCRCKQHWSPLSSSEKRFLVNAFHLTSNLLENFLRSQWPKNKESI